MKSLLGAPCRADGADDIEILMLVDKSTDTTEALCDRYAAGNPTRVRVIHQEKNIGNDGALGVCIEQASGIYFKIADSDDFLDEKALSKYLDILRGFAGPGSKSLVDMLVSNYLIENQNVGKTTAIQYGNVFPAGEVCTWESARPFRFDQRLFTHAQTYRTGLLRQCRLVFPTAHFSDAFYRMQPLLAIKSIYYLNVNLYHYIIGGAGQGSTETAYLRWVNDEYTVSKFLLALFPSPTLAALPPTLAGYLKIDLNQTVSSAINHLYMAGSSDSLTKASELFSLVKDGNPCLWHHFRVVPPMAFLVWLRGSIGRRVITHGSRLLRKIYGN
jgi:glycosyltransferase involved in cell wall biosynthesis